MSTCVGCSTDTTMERPANDIPDSDGKKRALDKVYLPLCNGCSAEADDHLKRRDADRPKSFGSPSGSSQAGKPDGQNTAPPKS